MLRNIFGGKAENSNENSSNINNQTSIQSENDVNANAESEIKPNSIISSVSGITSALTSVASVGLNAVKYAPSWLSSSSQTEQQKSATELNLIQFKKHIEDEKSAQGFQNLPEYLQEIVLLYVAENQEHVIEFFNKVLKLNAKERVNYFLAFDEKEFIKNPAAFSSLSPEEESQFEMVDKNKIKDITATISSNENDLLKLTENELKRENKKSELITRSIFDAVDHLKKIYNADYLSSSPIVSDAALFLVHFDYLQRYQLLALSMHTSKLNSKEAVQIITSKLFSFDQLILIAEENYLNDIFSPQGYLFFMKHQKDNIAKTSIELLMAGSLNFNELMELDKQNLLNKVFSNGFDLLALRNKLITVQDIIKANNSLMGYVSYQSISQKLVEKFIKLDSLKKLVEHFNSTETARFKELNDELNKIEVVTLNSGEIDIEAFTLKIQARVKKVLDKMLEDSQTFFDKYPDFADGLIDVVKKRDQFYNDIIKIFGIVNDNKQIIAVAAALDILDKEYSEIYPEDLNFLKTNKVFDSFKIKLKEFYEDKQLKAPNENSKIEVQEKQAIINEPSQTDDSSKISNKDANKPKYKGLSFFTINPKNKSQSIQEQKKQKPKNQ